MSAMNNEQLHRSTLGIYSNLMEEFNPGLQKLVSLGHSYVRAFQALAVKSEAYFTALSQMGEQAFHTMSSRSIGDVLIQIAESQKKLTLELEGVFRWFTEDILHEMDNNVRLDQDYISGSREQYEMSVFSQSAVMERQLRRGANQEAAEHLRFLRESHSEALKEEERRYRFLAEKHCGLIRSISGLMNKNGAALQQKADSWREEVNATRGRDAVRPPGPESSAQARQENWKNRDEQPLGNVPSRAPSPQGSIYRSTSESAGGAGRSTRARVAHQPLGSNPTLLHFDRGEMITVLVQQPKNGWLYGRAAGNNSRQGWFPASYVEEVDDLRLPADIGSSTPRARNNSSVSSRMDAPGRNTPPPPPPPLLSQSSKKSSQIQTGASDKTTESNPEKKRSQPHGSRPELFPRGTNPFATVKLKPTSTNDRSAPRLYR
ncbi:brain-specific angiogenesis inhibitor 1-associated protein 2-like protein 2 isoform X1 [Hippocampus zosterae]|uniref:brain-specific angiogenesis inhibitor 1-associated protein 2-like protein 2 isoform X1 n=2 Tax=Hippocampus zosterae TaxID=109293 RepID=UPI00223D58B2|nr:brain-specific angiogenesis inhibitor 1-associated protein 2-like protein 2 isoform X1 [Hippocampus zosterae]